MPDFIRYRQRLSELASSTLDGAIRDDVAENSLQLGAAAAKLLLGDDQSLHEKLAEGLKHLAALGSGPSCELINPLGQRRDVYYPFVLHLHLAAFSRCYESLSISVWGECEAAISTALEPARAAEQYSDRAPSPMQISVVLWQALCIYEQAIVLQRDTDAEWVDAVVHYVLAANADGKTLRVKQFEETEEHWLFDELCALHALANFALLARNKRWSRRVREMVRHHMEQDRTDLSLPHPWAIFAFVWSDAASADAILPEPADPLAAMLMADAANAMAEFET